MNKKISVVGLGKLGLCFAACAANRGFYVAGIDIEKAVVTSVNNGIAPWFEPELSELIKKHGGKNLKCSTTHSEAIQKSDITFILVATPSNPDGSFSNRFIEDALEQLSLSLKKSKKRHHTFVISSTVYPNSCENFITIVEKVSKKKHTKDFSIFYNPDFVKLGNVIQDFLYPDYVVIGSNALNQKSELHSFYKEFVISKPYVITLNLVSAELAKILLNCFITVKISYANLVGNICEKIKGAQTDLITKTLGLDKRISPFYLKSGLAFGGTCFPRDVRLLLKICKQTNVSENFVNAVSQINDNQNLQLWEKLNKILKQQKNPKIGILGLSFVPNSPVIAESPSIFIISRILAENVKVHVYDSYALEATRFNFGSNLTYHNEVHNLLKETTITLLMHNDQQMKNQIQKFKFNKQHLIIDCWRILKIKRKNLRIVEIGKNN